MSEPSPFLIGAAAVYALAPRSPVRFLFLWAEKYVADDFARGQLDTWARFVGFMLMVSAALLVEKLL